MPVYPCPECGAQLRPQNPVPAGKKLRCPKCETVFAPAGKTKAAAKTDAAPASAPPSAEEQYGLVENQETHNEEAARTAFDPIKNRFKLSARGPALILVVKPSTWLLRVGVFTCIAAIATGLYGAWPLIFKVEDVQPAKKGVVYGKQTNERRFIELNEEQYTEQLWIIAAGVFQFGWGAAICAGASKMHVLEAYPLAMIASVMSIAGPFLPVGIALLKNALTENDTMMVLPSVVAILCSLPFSFWCIATLRNKKVLAGFQEEKPEDY
jgi:hypothetical protein